MRVFLLLTTIFSLVLGCSTTAKKDQMPPPKDLKAPSLILNGNKDTESLDKYLLKIASSSEILNVYWWAHYHRARLWQEEGNHQLSCELYSMLAVDKQFPLFEVARLRSYQVCPKSVIPEDFGNLSYERAPQWIKTVSLQTELRAAEEQKNFKKSMELALEYSKLPLRKSLKIEYTEKALDYAKKIKDKQQIAKLKNRLYNLSPRLNPNKNRSNYLLAAYDYRRNREFKQAIHYYKKVINGRRYSKSQRFKAYRGLRRTYKLMEDKESYLQTSRQLALYAYENFKKSKSYYNSKKFHNSYISLAKAYWTEDQLGNAKQSLEFLQKKIKKHYSLAVVYWLHGRMKEEKGDFKAAIWWFNRALAEKKIDQEQREKIMWNRAWNLRKVKDYDKALASFQELVDFTDDVYRQHKFNFWLAKTYEDLKKVDKANETYKKLIKNDPLGYYGLLAHRELDKPVMLPQRREISSVHELDVTAIEDRVDLDLIGWMIALDENDLAKNYLDTELDEYRRSKKNNQDELVAFYNLYAMSGNYLGLFAQMGYLKPEERKEILLKHTHLIFPQPFQNEVEQAANRFSIYPEYIYAIMRQESAFNTRARSHMDAFGLMQLLPRVARKSAQKIQLPFNQAEDLYHPHIGIPLGSAHLRELWDKYDGRFVLATASYNANEEAIQGWLKTRYNGNTIEFIEDIPYAETQNYVKLVMRNMIFYQLIQSQEKSIPFPEWALNI